MLEIIWLLNAMGIFLIHPDSIKVSISSISFGENIGINVNVRIGNEDEKEKQ